MNVGATTSILLIRAVDAGGTYVSFRWLDDPGHPRVHVITAPKMNRALARLDEALIGADGDDRAEAVRRALTGPFTRYLGEYTVSEALSRVILPESVTAAIVRRSRVGRVLIRVTPSQFLAGVPFELLVVDGATRMIELADISYEPPAAVHLGRARDPLPWSEEVARRPVLYVVDPVLPAGSGLRQVTRRSPRTSSDRSDADLFRERIESRSHTVLSGVGKLIDRWDLSDELRLEPSRFFYFGHVSSTVDQPGSASVHLSDDGHVWGLAETIHGAHRPLAALDLLLGTSSPELGAGEADHLPEGVPGHRLWPMPPRVAVIACEGGIDYRSSETFGLVVAMFSAGAEALVTTRWTLPSDAAFAEFSGVDQGIGPTTELALAVDESQTEQDPVAALAEWQRRKLDQWRDSPGPATSPLTWAAVGTHVCPRREVTMAPAEENS
ncbi:CHAT domain-containing protein [Gordonia alkanivorans]|uniref:CHAT domain-containing protein n=1 Tax=Gordonia alkanivorans TaxID=84096 RepID=UPI001F4DE5F9|nr:CHAT domain-containing protein [Gordonia alkanivorans]